MSWSIGVCDIGVFGIGYTRFGSLWVGILTGGNLDVHVHVVSSKIFILTLCTRT